MFVCRDDDLDALAQEIEGTRVGPPTPQGEPPEQASSLPVQQATSLEAAEGTEGDQEASTVMTAAQKKAAKKEREKKKKEALKKAKQPPKIDDTQSAAVTNEPVEADKEPVADDQSAEVKGQSAEAEVQGSAIGEEKTEGTVGGSGGEEEEDDKKKKKKKKKKATEEEKKSKVSFHTGLHGRHDLGQIRERQWLALTPGLVSNLATFAMQRSLSC